ncbi:uncharacterized protein LOC141677117 [Apium graveolens]|uniref:uncharacterized protein LOC141677117 n=1 Tax=Apium graveolens TaxID=4045 RepID=UPI003D7B2696
MHERDGLHQNINNGSLQQIRSNNSSSNVLQLNKHNTNTQSLLPRVSNSMFIHNYYILIFVIGFIYRITFFISNTLLSLGHVILENNENHGFQWTSDASEAKPARHVESVIDEGDIFEVSHVEGKLFLYYNSRIMIFLQL